MHDQPKQNKTKQTMAMRDTSSSIPDGVCAKSVMVVSVLSNNKNKMKLKMVPVRPALKPFT